MVTKLLSHVTHNARMHCHKRDWLMVVALFAPPLEAWIRWVAPFYALTITFRKRCKPNCAHLASDSVVDQATSSVLQAARCLLSSSSCAPNQLKITRQKTKNPKILSMCQYGCLSIMIMQRIVKQNQNQNQKPFSS